MTRRLKFNRKLINALDNVFVNRETRGRKPLAQGTDVYLKKTGEKFSIYDYDKRNKTYTIMDMAGTGFYGMNPNEFKRRKR